MSTKNPSLTPEQRIVSSSHLVSEKSPELSEFEFGLIIAAHAFNRWLIRCMGAAGVKDMTATDVLVLHHINMGQQVKQDGRGNVVGQIADHAHLGHVHVLGDLGEIHAQHVGLGHRELAVAAKALRQIAAGRAAHGDRFLIPYYSSGSGLTGRSIHRPVGTITTRDRWAVIEGDKMRMLAVPEARDAMSFPPSYVLPNVHRDAMHLLGNAVCPVVAADFLNELRLAA